MRILIIFLFLSVLVCYPSVIFCEAAAGECSALISWGEPDSIGSSFGAYWTTSQRALIALSNIPPYYIGILIGLVLSDGWLLFATPQSKNALLGLRQSINHFEFFWSMFLVLSVFCQSLPIFAKATR